MNELFACTYCKNTIFVVDNARVTRAQQLKNLQNKETLQSWYYQHIARSSIKLSILFSCCWSNACFKEPIEHKFAKIFVVSSWQKNYKFCFKILEYFNASFSFCNLKFDYLYLFVYIYLLIYLSSLLTIFVHYYNTLMSISFETSS